MTHWLAGMRRRYYFKLADYEQARGSHSHEWIAKHVLGISLSTWKRRLRAAASTGYIELRKLEADALRADLGLSTVNPNSEPAQDGNGDRAPHLAQLHRRSLEEQVADLAEGQELLIAQLHELMRRLDEQIDVRTLLEDRLERLEAERSGRQLRPGDQPG